MSNIESRIVVTRLAPIPVEDIDRNWPHVIPEAQEVREAVTRKWVCNAPRFGVWDLAPTNDSILEARTWTGEEWYVWSRDFERGQTFHTRRKSPPSSHVDDTISLFNGGVQAVSFVGANAVSRMIASFPLKSIRAEGELTIVELATSELSDSASIVVEYKNVPDFVLLSLRLDIFRMEGDGHRRLSLRKILNMSDHREFNGVMVPWRAHRLGSVYTSDMKNSGQPAMVNVRVLERLGLMDIAANVSSEVLAKVPPEAGDIVLDHRLGVSYRIGESTVYVDELGVATATPIAGFLSGPMIQALTRSDVRRGK